MGFAPVVAVRTNAWQTTAGKARFVNLVQERMALELEQPPTVRWTNELEGILNRAIRLDDASTLNEPSEEVIQAISYASVLYVTRVKMHRRLSRMRMGTCASALQPRGTDDAARFDALPGKAVRNSGTHYASFLDAQRKLRTRLS